ncbi:MAG: dihydropteroate synthase [Candidatus Kapaibacterium sp.]
MNNRFPEIMGILNVTPDSFSDGGRHYARQEAIKGAFRLIDEGADILDVGGESTRPGSDSVPEDEELKRIVPVIEAVRKDNSSIKISIDTTKYAVAKAALDAGADIINDISGLNYDKKLAELAAERDCPLIVMHMQGIPKTMQDEPRYNNVVEDVFHDLQYKINLAYSYKVKKVWADTGIGFGKNMEHNLQILKNHDEFTKLNVPLVLGLSRKSFIGRITGIENPGERDLPTLIIHALLADKKIDVIRVHDVKSHNMLRDIKSYF